MQLIKNVRQGVIVYLRDGALQVDQLPTDTTVIVFDDTTPPAIAGIEAPAPHQGAQGEVAHNTPSRSVATPVRDAAVAQAPGSADQTAGSGGNVKTKKHPNVFKAGELVEGRNPSKIVAVLTAERRTVAEIATACGVDQKRCGIELCRLVKIGKAERAGPGLYTLPAAGVSDAPPQAPEAPDDSPSTSADTFADIPRFGLPTGTVRTVTFGERLK